MKLKSIHIENFRSIKNETIELDDYTCMVGANGTGKSTVLQALNIFFRNTAGVTTGVWTLTQEDFHHRGTSSPVTVTLTFQDLSADAQKDLHAYYRQDKLIVSAKATWNPDTASAEVKQYGSRLVMRDFAPFFAADNEGAKLADLRPIYTGIREQHQELPSESTKRGMTEALQSYEKERPDLCELVESSSQFYGWTRGTNLLDKYIQWVYVPAIKQPSEEQEEGTRTALGQLLQRTVRGKVDFESPLADLKADLKQRYQQLLDDNKGLLGALERSLESRLQQWATPGATLSIGWRYDPDKSVVINTPSARVSIGEDDFMGEVARLGHGLQRAFLVSMLQELATAEEEDGATLLLGFEEPELYLHPPQAQHVSNLLEVLARERQHNSQVLLTTHSPYFVSSKGFESVRLFRKDPSRRFSTVTATDYKQLEALLSAALSQKPGTPSSLMARIEQVMQPSQKELFFANLAVLVEGPEDVAFISTCLHLTERWDEFRRCGCHFVVCECKTNMSRPLAIALQLGIRAFVVFDSDTNKRKPDEINKNRRDNACLLALSAFCSKRPDEINVIDVATIPDTDALSSDTLWRGSGIMWSPNLAAVVHADFGQSVWDAAEARAREKHQLTGDVRRKNPMLVAATIEHLYSDSKSSQLLEKACDAILSAARSVSP